MLNFKTSKMKATTLKTILGRIIRVTPNHSDRTFTIRVESGKYRTVKMSKQEFNSCLYNTGDDWGYFLTSEDYYKVK